MVTSQFSHRPSFLFLAPYGSSSAYYELLGVFTVLVLYFLNDNEVENNSLLLPLLGLHSGHQG